jgi:hypothetical protein
MDTQREELAKRGVDHDKYDVFLSEADHLDEETTSIMVRQKSSGKQREKTLNLSRRQLAETDNTLYIDTIVELVKQLEAVKGDRDKQFDVKLEVFHDNRKGQTRLIEKPLRFSFETEEEAVAFAHKLTEDK